MLFPQPGSIGLLDQITVSWVMSLHSGSLEWGHIKGLYDTYIYICIYIERYNHKP